VHTESGAAPGMGLPGALGEQAHRHRRPDGAGPRADESAERARLADVARLPVATLRSPSRFRRLADCPAAFLVEDCAFVCVKVVKSHAGLDGES
jgi:hypothetical protein